MTEEKTYLPHGERLRAWSNLAPQKCSTFHRVWSYLGEWIASSGKTLERCGPYCVLVIIVYKVCLGLWRLLTSESSRGGQPGCPPLRLCVPPFRAVCPLQILRNHGLTSYFIVRRCGFYCAQVGRSSGAARRAFSTSLCRSLLSWLSRLRFSASTSSEARESTSCRCFSHNLSNSCSTS